MAQKLKCRICGKGYIPCKSATANNSAFNWREVACCQEHGQEYLKQIIASRMPAEVKVEKATPRKKQVTEQIQETESVE